MLVFALAMAGFQTAAEVLLHRIVSLGEAHCLTALLPLCLKSTCVATDHHLHKARISLTVVLWVVKTLISFYISFVVIYNDVACHFHHHYKWNVIFWLVT